MNATSTRGDGLKADRYSLTMRDSGRNDGLNQRQVTIEVFARRLPAGRRYGVVAGTGRLLERLTDFRFTDDTLAYLQNNAVVSDDTIASLYNYKFRGDVYGYREGDVYFGNSPILTIQTTWGAAIPLEAFISGILNSDSATASAASRMVNAAQGRQLIEMGSRRVDPDAAANKARAAYIAGFAGTSNLEAGLLYGIPTLGTSAHAFTLAFETPELSTSESEKNAFRAQIRQQGIATTLLVDTYDIEQGIRNAVEVAKEFGATGPGKIRIDSKVLRDEAVKGRAQLDELGALNTEIVLSGDLNEFLIDELAQTDSPANFLGVGESVVLGSGAPTAEFVFKGVEIEVGFGTGVMKPTAKFSEGKATRGGRKFAYREMRDGLIVREFLTTEPIEALPSNIVPVQVQLMTHGQILVPTSAEEARAHHQRVMASLPAEAREVSPGEPAIAVQFASPTEEKTMTAATRTYKKAIIFTDPNNDFTVDGSLPVEGANAAYFAEVDAYLAKATANGDVLLIASSDEHIAPGGHWSDNPDYEVSFPVHCEKGTWGAEFHPLVNKNRIREIFYKGNYEAAFSGFEGVSRSGVTMEDYLRAHGVEEIEVIGLATDFCDKATAIDSFCKGFLTTVNTEYCRGVSEQGTIKAVQEMATLGISLV